MNKILAVVLISFMSLASCRDFYVGMFKKNDWLVAQDRLYKERVPYKYMYAKYGRIFKCKITYFRIADRLGYGPGPKVQIVRGGLSHKYLVLRLTSPYNMPISVNIYVGCANTFTTTKASTRANVTNSETITTKHTIPGSQKPGGISTTGGECTGNCTDSTQATAVHAATAETTVAPTTV